MPSVPNEVSRFFSRMRLVRNVVLRAEQKISKHMAINFNIFEDIFAAAINENSLSDAIAWLLDPGGTHGQGDMFLRLFVGELNISFDTIYYNVKVVREKTTTAIESNLRRIDIVIFGQDWIIGIENKPWATEQNNQISDYQLYLDRQNKASKFIVYISGCGDDACTINRSSQTEYKLMRYSRGQCFEAEDHSLAGWIKKCRINCEAESVRWFLSHFYEYIQSNF